MKGSKGPKHSHKVTVTSVVVSVLLRLHKQAKPANQRIERLGRAAGARVAPTAVDNCWTVRASTVYVSRRAHFVI